MIKIRSIPRLTIIFICAVTIPGGMLSYFSIQNITNLKELTERRVLEEQEGMATLVKENYNAWLDATSHKFESAVSEIHNNDYGMIRYTDTIAFLNNPFILQKNGSFLWPVFKEDVSYEEENFTPAFMNTFSII